MVEQICNLLNLNVNAGLGRRLIDVEINQDAQNPNLFNLFPKQTMVQMASLAVALSIRADEILGPGNLSFKARHILVSC